MPGLFYIYFRLFNTVDSNQMFNINFTNDWIRTMDLWYQKQPLYLLSHSHSHGSNYFTFEAIFIPMKLAFRFLSVAYFN